MNAAFEDKVGRSCRYNVSWRLKKRKKKENPTLSTGRYTVYKIYEALPQIQIKSDKRIII